MKPNGQHRHSHNGAEKKIIQEQRVITSCALEVIDAFRQQRGKPLQSRDRMALKLLTPKNAALMQKEQRRFLGCRQISFEILTDDLGLGSYRLIPVGVHVYNPERGWWNDDYGVRRFLWNLYLNEEPVDGMQRILERLFKLAPQDLQAQMTCLEVTQAEHDIKANVTQDLSLYIRRHKGSVETSLRRLHKAQGLCQAHTLGIDTQGQGRMALVFGKSRRYAVTFAVERV